MKKFLLLTVCAFGLIDLVPTADCYAGKGRKNTSRRQSTATTTKAVPPAPSRVAAPTSDEVGSIVSAGTGATAIPVEKSPVLAIEDAKPELALSRARTEARLTAGSSDEGAIVVRTVDDPKVQKAWDKNVAAVKGTLGILKGAVDQLDTSAEAYKKGNSEDQLKDQNAIAQAITSILKSIESIQGSIDSLGRFKSNDSIQKYLAAFVNDLTAKTKDAFLSTSRRGTQVDPAKVTVTTKNLGSIKATLEALNQFLLQHRKFLGVIKSTKATDESLSATYSFEPSASKGEVTVEDTFKPAVDGDMFDGKKDKELVKTLGVLQGIIKGLIADLTEALKASLGKEESLKKKAQFLIKKVQASGEMKKTGTDFDTMLYMKKAADVRSILVQLETYRQELEHMLGVIKKSQEKSAGSVQAKADYDLIVTFHETLDKVLGAMVSKVGNVQLKPIFQQWMPKKQETLGILKLAEKEKQTKLEEIRGWLTTLQTVRA